MVNECPDIEDVVCPKTGKMCSNSCKTDWDLVHNAEDKSLCVKVGQQSWYKVYNIESLLQIWRNIGNSTYRLAAGNTGKGNNTLSKNIFKLQGAF